MPWLTRFAVGGMQKFEFCAEELGPQLTHKITCIKCISVCLHRKGEVQLPWSIVTLSFKLRLQSKVSSCWLRTAVLV